MKRKNYRLYGAILGAVAIAVAAGPGEALELNGYDSTLDQGLYKYSPRFREMAEFPPTEGLIDEGQDLFKKDRDGKSCETCHGEDGERLVGAATGYPKYNPKLGKPQLIQQKINECLTEQMGQAPLKDESSEQILLITYVKALSNGMPLAVQTDGPMAPFLKAGKESYFTRIGHFDVSCSSCHHNAAGANIRAEYLSTTDNTGQSKFNELVVQAMAQKNEQDQRNMAGGTIGSGSIDHWPTYRLKWGQVATMQRRLKTCNKNVRAQPKASGDDYYVNLELYLASISNGLPMNVPGIRP
ncbi:MAG: sulfur oxidation c-type cytochrome SoxA [Magnetococcales bacterium]|nr:sulfur oxidation c-type cytochrome SoxA [Magnetococcales bacterium]